MTSLRKELGTWSGNTRIQDVISTLAGLAPGEYGRDALYDRYVQATYLRDWDPSDSRSFGQVLRHLGVSRRVCKGESLRRIDPAALQERWSDYDWEPLDFNTSGDKED